MHTIWRNNYRNDRYLDHLSGEDLDRRLKDILLNCVILTNEDKIDDFVKSQFLKFDPYSLLVAGHRQNT